MVLGSVILACNNNKTENSNTDSLSLINSVQIKRDAMMNAPLDTQSANSEDIITLAKSDIAEG